MNDLISLGTVLVGITEAMDRIGKIDTLEKIYYWEGLDRARDILKMYMLYSRRSSWIPCSERLPEHELVLVQFSDGDFSLLQFPTVYRRKDMVAWMPLPEPYKEDTDGDK